MVTLLFVAGVALGLGVLWEGVLCLLWAVWELLLAPFRSGMGGPAESEDPPMPAFEDRRRRGEP